MGLKALAVHTQLLSDQFALQLQGSSAWPDRVNRAYMVRKSMAILETFLKDAGAWMDGSLKLYNMCRAQPTLPWLQQRQQVDLGYVLVLVAVLTSMMVL